MNGGWTSIAEEVHNSGAIHHCTKSSARRHPNSPAGSAASRQQKALRPGARPLRLAPPSCRIRAREGAGRGVFSPPAVLYDSGQRRRSRRQCCGPVACTAYPAAAAPWRQGGGPARMTPSRATAPRWCHATPAPRWASTSARGRSSAPGGGSGSTWPRPKRYRDPAPRSPPDAPARPPRPGGWSSSLIGGGCSAGAWNEPRPPRSGWAGPLSVGCSSPARASAA